MKTRVGRRKNNYIALILVIVLAYGMWVILRPLPPIQPQIVRNVISAKTPPSALTWPTSQAAVSIVGTDILETSGESKPVPTASTAKVITALMVLEAKPLELKQPGPMITLTDADVAIYKSYVAQDGSVVPVQAGEQISEYQALQTVMLPSANNMADSLAIWAYGSLDEYAKAANKYLADHGIKNTHIGADASGLSADSISTSSDLVQIGVLAMQNPVLAEIVGQSTATDIPLAGTIKNVNVLLGTNGIIGVKTGNSEQAGGAYISASQTKVNDKQVVIVTAVSGSPTLFVAMKDSLPLIKSAQANFSNVAITKTGQNLARFKLPWGGTVNALASKELSSQQWNGKMLTANVQVQEFNPKTAKKGQTIGQVTIRSSAINNKKSVSVILESTPTTPSVFWKLTHPFF